MAIKDKVGKIILIIFVVIIILKILSLLMGDLTSSTDTLATVIQ